MWMADGQVRGLLAGHAPGIAANAGRSRQGECQRVLQAMYKMKKIIIADLERLPGLTTSQTGQTQRRAALCL